jgi:hypothetical protein
VTEIFWESPNPERDPGQPTVFQIRIKGRLGPRWKAWFEDMDVTLDEHGDSLLTGPVDQAALHGLLKRVRDLGVILVSVNPVEAGESDPPDPGLTTK